MHAVDPGRARRYLPLAFLAAGFGLLLWLYWPVIVTGSAAFVVVHRILKLRVPRRHRGRFLRETAPRWVEALAALRIARKVGR